MKIEISEETLVKSVVSICNVLLILYTLLTIYWKYSLVFIAGFVCAVVFWYIWE